MAEINAVAVAEKKSGFLTSEFWLGLAGIVATVGAAVAPFVPAPALAWIAGVSVFVPTVYAVCRTVVKATATKTDDAFMDALAAKLAPLIKLEAPK